MAPVRLHNSKSIVLIISSLSRVGSCVCTNRSKWMGELFWTSLLLLNAQRSSDTSLLYQECSSWRIYCLVLAIGPPAEDYHLLVFTCLKPGMKSSDAKPLIWAFVCLLSGCTRISTALSGYCSSTIPHRTLNHALICAVSHYRPPLSPTASSTPRDSRVPHQRLLNLQWPSC